MRHRIQSQLVPALLVVIGASGMMWLSGKDAPPPRAAQQPAPVLVETVPLQAGVSAFQIHVSGNVLPRREITISAEVAGTIVFKESPVESGRYVRENADLMRIDRERFRLRVDELESELAQVAVNLRQLTTEESGLKSQIGLAQRDVEIAAASSKRVQDLASQNASSQAETENAERKELEARRSLAVLENQLARIPVSRDRLQAERQLIELRKQRAQLDLDRTQITAPFSGLVTDVMVEQGDYVQAGDVMLKLDDVSTMDVECSLRLDDLYWLWNSAAVGSTDPDDELSNPDRLGDSFEIPPAAATVSGEVAGREFQWSGKLERYGGRGFSRKTRTVLCRVRVDHPRRAADEDGPPTLMRGMYVHVTLDVEPKVPLWRIPTLAVQPNGRVWTVEDNTLREHIVRPARVLPDGVLVRASSTDLKAGDHLVVTQLTTPLDGTAVRERVTSARPASADSGFGGDGGDGGDGGGDGDER